VQKQQTTRDIQSNALLGGFLGQSIFQNRNRRYVVGTELRLTSPGVKMTEQQKMLAVY